MSVDLDKVIEIEEGIISSNNNDGTVIIMKADDSDLFYKINGVAAQVWSAIEKGEPTISTIKKISEDFDIESKQIEKDVNEFIENLLAYKIIK